MHEHSLVIDLSALLALAVGAQWIAWKLRLPSILLLLASGLLAGAGASLALGEPLLQPDLLFGDLLGPLTSLSVAVILYEGGLSLRLREIRYVRKAVRNLVTLGAATTWVGCTAAAWLTGLLEPGLAVLLGAILIVTGPTVISPLLRHIRPKGSVGPVLKWEGIVTDPIGAILAVLVFEALLATSVQVRMGTVALGFVRAGLAGGILGVAGAGLLILTVRRHWVPEYLENPVSLMILVVCFSASNAIQEESGLIAVTVMGSVVGNVLGAEAQPIVRFKENLQVLLIGGLFVVLSARLSPDDLEVALTWQSAAFLALLILVVRPMAVAVATAGGTLSWQERVLMAWMAPRGIVAAAVASVFALRLVNAGQVEARALAPVTFLVIIVTVSLYGLTAGPLARRLGLAEGRRTGLLILGAQRWVRDLALLLQTAGVEVKLVDSNHRNVSLARMLGLEAVHGNFLSTETIEAIGLESLGHFAAMTPNDAVNTLAVDRMTSEFGRARVYQLHPHREANQRHEPDPHSRSQTLFGEQIDHIAIDERLRSGDWELKATRLTEAFGLEAWREHYGPDAWPLAFVNADGGLAMWVLEPTPTTGLGTLVALVPLSPPGQVKPDPHG